MSLKRINEEDECKYCKADRSGPCTTMVAPLDIFVAVHWQPNAWIAPRVMEAQVAPFIVAPIVAA